MTADGRYAVISGGPRLNQFEVSGTAWVIDLLSRRVVATVSGVCNDPYGLAVVNPRGDDD